MKRSSILQLFGGIALASLGLYIFLRDVSPARLWQDLRATSLWAVAAGVLFTVLTLWLRSIRWNMILPRTQGASRDGLFGIVMIGFMVNNLLPARIGEAARIVLLWQRNRFTLTSSVGSVLLERIIDTVMFFLLFSIPVFLVPKLHFLLPYALPIALGCAAGFLLLLFYALFPRQTRVLGKAVLRLVPEKPRVKLTVIAKDLMSNLDWVFSPGKFLAMILLSTGIIACHPVMLMILAGKGFGVLGGMFAGATAAFGAAIPLSPGYVGTLHAALKEGLLLFDVETNKAIAIATVYHAIGYVTITAIGLFYFFRMRISFKDIGRAKEIIGRKEQGTREGGGV